MKMYYAISILVRSATSQYQNSYHQLYNWPDPDPEYKQNDNDETTECYCSCENCDNIKSCCQNTCTNCQPAASVIIMPYPYPIFIQQEQKKPSTDSSSTTDQPTTENSITKGQPTSETDILTSMTDIPTSKTDKPTSTTEKPTSTTEKPTSTTEHSTSTTDQPITTPINYSESYEEIYYAISILVRSATSQYQNSYHQLYNWPDPDPEYKQNDYDETTECYCSCENCDKIQSCCPNTCTNCRPVVSVIIMPYPYPIFIQQEQTKLSTDSSTKTEQTTSMTDKLTSMTDVLITTPKLLSNTGERMPDEIHSINETCIDCQEAEYGMIPITSKLAEKIMLQL
ncbi:unnamed protein product [Leptidea sinapis]|uniref:Uncharacterized protein n=1 Tax=Leptidea sinapis TaxID=189913 RepID=A0A5E4QV09_9NEOP|nr:unnamed protein product [Leptidea sinapis]